MTKVLVAAGILLLGAVVAELINRYLSGTLETLAANTIGRAFPGGTTDLRGRWTSTYTYRHGGTDMTASQVMDCKQTGNIIRAKNVGGSSPHRHEIRLKIDGLYVTGEWHNKARGASHYGTMQLRLSPSGTSMKGKWVGFDSAGEVQHGDWDWSRQ